MSYINLISILTIVFMSILFIFLKINITRHKCLDSKKLCCKKNEWFSYYYAIIVALIFLSGVIVRFICAVHFDGHADMDCFKYWGSLVYDHGFGSFYESQGLSDYMPGYIYILRGIEAIRSLLGLAYDGIAATVLYKIPAMAFDMAIAYMLYKISRKHFDICTSMLITSMFIFNPVVILNSAVWGQIDSILTFALMLMCYLVYKNNLRFAYIVFGLGCLIKPQMFVFTPVLLFAFIENIFVHKDKNGKVSFKFMVDNLFMQGTYAVISIAVTLLLCMPFGLGNVIKQCFDTMGSYEYASVNAYNFWAMLGLDWAPQDDYLFFLTYKQWGYLCIILLVVVSLIIWIDKINDRSRYLIIAAFLGIGMFTFSVRMHERYIYPAIMVLLLLFIVIKKANVFWMYLVFSVINFYNSAHVLFYYDPYNFDSRGPVIILSGLASTIAFTFLIIFIKKYYLGNRKLKGKYSDLLVKTPSKREYDKRVTVEVSEKVPKMTSKDWLIAIVISVLYGVIAFYNLGDRNVPESSCYIDSEESVVFKFDKDTQISKMEYYLGNYEEREFDVFASDDGENWINLGNLTMESVFRWDSYKIDTATSYIRLSLISEKAVINEIVFRDADNNIIEPLNSSDDNIKELFDEQILAADEFTYRNGTIFDEIYHARSAYEFNNGLYCYEWTHPPLGKVFISLGMKIFGTNPFGWRFAGTLFGILMLPFMYVFGKKMFKSTFFATVTCLFMAFDFMHFAQTRIATIDVFVTFFVIAMYYFMYRYYQMSFYDKSLKKTFVPLALSGICMGLGCASKWTGVYAGAGLGVIFFYTMYKRYREYRYALQTPDESSNGIKHLVIINKFVRNFWLTIAFCVVFFVIVPGIIYTLSYIPFVGNDESPTSLIGRMIYNQSQMFTYHKDCIFDHPYSSRWYEWALMLKPILYYSGTTPAGKLERISSFGNPLLWWVGIGAFIYMIYKVKKYKDKTALFLVIGYLSQMLPWTLVVRTTFIYHYFTSVPFVLLMDAYCTYCLLKRDKKNIKIILLYVILVGLAFVVFYPALSGAPMSEFYDHNILRWISGWYV